MMKNNQTMALKIFKKTHVQSLIDYINIYLKYQPSCSLHGPLRYILFERISVISRVRMSKDRSQSLLPVRRKW